MQTLKLFVTGHKGFETLLFHEVRAILGATDAVLEKKYGGVEVSAGIDAVYRLCLHSRLANRVFCELARAPVEDEAQLYQAIYAIDWGLHLEAGNSIAVSATLSRSKLNHGHFVALRVKGCDRRPVSRALRQPSDGGEETTRYPGSRQHSSQPGDHQPRPVG